MTRPTPGVGVRRRTLVPTLPTAELAGLDLPALRAYRHGLEAEEDRVSYWRRLVHARIDVLEAEALSDAPLGVADLVRVLGDTGTGQARSALVSVRPAEPLPELPELAEMWVVEIDPHDAAAVADALERLRRAEAQLTTYRRALHERIDQATGELILRYREDPRAALVLIPKE